MENYFNYVEFMPCFVYEVIDAAGYGNGLGQGQFN